MKAYSEDLRIRAIKLIDAGKELEKVAILLNIGRSSLYLWLKQRKKKGSLAAKKNWQKGYGDKVRDLEEFKKFVELCPGLTAVERFFSRPI